MPALIHLREPETDHLESVCEEVSCGVLVARYYPYISSGKMLTPEKVSRLADISVLTPWGRARQVNNRRRDETERYTWVACAFSDFTKAPNIAVSLERKTTIFIASIKYIRRFYRAF